MTADSNRITSKPHVVLIHGLAGHWFLMWPLAWQIKKLGFTTSTFGYRSWFRSIEHHALRFKARLEKLEQDPTVEAIHIVAHSMGSIVTRQAILDSRFSKLQRIVMLGPPNQGSPMAKFLGYILPFCKTLRQVSNRSNSFVKRLPEPQSVEVGIVAAQYDRVIPEPNSHLANESDHICIFSGHNGLLIRPVAMKQVASFLEHGKFFR